MIMGLLSQHQKFHGFLDRIVARTNDASKVSLLIEIRRVNIECISKYTDLLSRQNHSSRIAAVKISSKLKGFNKEDMTLWNIHAQLARFMPLYNESLHNKYLSQVSKMIISQNYDQIVLLKEHLLHPLPTVEMA